MSEDFEVGHTDEALVKDLENILELARSGRLLACAVVALSFDPEELFESESHPDTLEADEIEVTSAFSIMQAEGVDYAEPLADELRAIVEAVEAGPGEGECSE